MKMQGQFLLQRLILVDLAPLRLFQLHDDERNIIDQRMIPGERSDLLEEAVDDLLRWQRVIFFEQAEKAILTEHLLVDIGGFRER
jgi:hypothetical protein